MFCLYCNKKEVSLTTLTWYGHAALGLETGGHKLVIDPFLNGNPTASISPDRVEADYILISHGHGDDVAIAKPNQRRFL
jgi:L-ascorbate metabolism protein UlaG (beta-lactamase superfamily)